MTDAEIKRQLANGEDPLMLSIEKYEDMICDHKDYQTINLSPNNCALCHKYFNNGCMMCPITIQDPEHRVCIKTPYERMQDAVAVSDESAFWRAALDELYLLKSLVPVAEDGGVVSLLMDNGSKLHCKLIIERGSMRLAACDKSGGLLDNGRIFDIETDGRGYRNGYVLGVPIRGDEHSRIMMRDDVGHRIAGSERWKDYKIRLQDRMFQIQDGGGTWWPLCELNEYGELEIIANNNMQDFKALRVTSMNTVVTIDEGN